VIAALDLDRRIERASHAAAYLVVNVPIAILGALCVIALVLGAALSVAWIGLPLLLGAAAACRRLVSLDRRAANTFLGTHIPPVPAGVATAGSPWRRSLDILSDRALWRMVALLATKPLLIAGLCIVALVPLALLAKILSLGVQGVGGLGTIDYLGPWRLGLGLGIVLLALVPAAAVLVIATLDALYSVLCAIGRALLAPRAAPSGPVRELLAESLGDRSVAIAYWLPDREAFVDEAGRPVALPEPGSGRAWTAVEQDGRRVAAIVHDAALDTSPELVEAAAAAASLAIDNERLKADLRARVEDLRVSRLRIVEAADEARRRIERDLHDGAQQQLLALALELRVLRSSISDPEAGPLVDGLAVRLEAALSDLRELARGIHPAILTRSGLDPAIAALADRSPVPVHVESAVDGRLAPAVEAAAYFVVAEALTNVARYAEAEQARVELRGDGNGGIVVVVADDGVGGADPRAGSGLRGLQDRLAVVDGVLTIDSPRAPARACRRRSPRRRSTREARDRPRGAGAARGRAGRLRRDDARARAHRGGHPGPVG
jgi:signal transduction histidine kinase